MGLFDKLRGKAEKKTSLINQDQPPAQHTEEWDLYYSDIDNIPGSLMVDLGLARVAPVAGTTNLVWISIQMRNPTTDGFATQEESDLLNEIENSLLDTIAKQHISIYAGRLTCNGKRTLYFYFSGISLYDQTISQSMVKFPNYNFDYGTQEDKIWAIYFDFLYPMPHQYQMILNRRVITNLQNNGDHLTKERLVDHWIYFKNETDTENYITEIVALDFNILSKNIRESPDSFTHQLNIGRIDKADYHSVNEYVLDLWELARKHHGFYDGWGCPVVKE